MVLNSPNLQVNYVSVYRNFYQISAPFASNGRVKYIKLHDEMGQNVS